MLYSFKLTQTHQIANQLSLCLRKRKGFEKPTAQNILNEEFVENLIQHDDGYQLLKNVKSSPSYWQDKKKNLMAMIRQLGIPTFFITLSAAETKWTELIIILEDVLHHKKITAEEVENLTWEHKADMIRRDPITCSRYFDYRVRTCHTHLFGVGGIFKQNPVIDYFTRIEFQHRGSPHLHGLYWCQDAPKFDEDNPKSFEECSSFIDNYISCSSSIEGIVHQNHKHTDTCQVSYNVNFIVFILSFIKTTILYAGYL